MHAILGKAREFFLSAGTDRVGVTERAVQRIVTDLEEAGYLIRR